MITPSLVTRIAILPPDRLPSKPGIRYKPSFPGTALIVNRSNCSAVKVGLCCAVVSPILAAASSNTAITPPFKILLFIIMALSLRNAALLMPLAR